MAGFLSGSESWRSTTPPADLRKHGDHSEEVSKPMKILNVTIQASEPVSMSAAAKNAEVYGVKVELMHGGYLEMEADPAFFKKILRSAGDADLTIVRCMAEPERFKSYKKLEEKLKTSDGFSIVFTGTQELQYAYRHMFRGSDDDFSLLIRYLTQGGAENELGIISWLSRAVGEEKVPYIEPVLQISDGIFHPARNPSGLEDYRQRISESKPTVGIFFGNCDIHNSNTQHIEALIRKVESSGMNSIPVFFNGRAGHDDEGGLSTCVKKYTMEDGQSLLDATIMLTGASQVLKSGKADGFSVGYRDNPFELSDTVAVQAISVHGEWRDFEEDPSGLDKENIVLTIIRPEVDGQIISVPFARINKGDRKSSPIDDRIDHIVDLVKRWADLHRKPNPEKKIVLILYQPREDFSCIGSAGGLDVIQSVVSILKRMGEDGYRLDWIPENGEDLLRRLLDGINNNVGDVPSSVLKERAIDLIDRGQYTEVFESLYRFNQDRLVKSWGKLPGKVCVDGDKIVVPGIMNGNVMIGFQPVRAWGDQTEAIYHDPVVPAPHQYVQYYRWIKHDFGADAVVHMGTHGSLEWLPCKSVALSGKCEPNMMIDGIPNLYPFCVDNPGEGTQGRRRIEAVLLGYLPPVMMRADSYDDLAVLEKQLQEYFLLKNSSSEERRNAMVSNLLDMARNANLLEDMKLDKNIGPDVFVEYIGDLHEYISDLKNALIRDGFHIFGEAPKDGMLDEMMYSIMRLDNGDVPSLRDSLGAAMGIDVQSALDEPSGISERGIINSVEIDSVEERMEILLKSSGKRVIVWTNALKFYLPK